MSLIYVQQAEREQSAVAASPFHTMTLPNGALWTYFYRCDAGYLLRFPRLADFEVSSDGSQVQAWPAPGVTTGTVEHLHLNQVLPLALSRQGKLMLHGSAVDVDGQGVAFVGVSGRGKSTLAASFATAGRRFLSDDDVRHLEWSGTGLQIIPSHPVGSALGRQPGGAGHGIRPPWPPPSTSPPRPGCWRAAISDIAESPCHCAESISWDLATPHT